MNEPKSWLEDGAPRDVRYLFRAAKAELPGETSLGRTLTALGVGLGATSSVAGSAIAGSAASTGAAKATAPITLGLLAKWTALGATLGTLTIGATTIAFDAPLRMRAPPLPVGSAARARPGAPAAPLFPQPAAVKADPAHGIAKALHAPSSSRVASSAAPASAVPLGAAASSAADSAVPSDAETLAEELRSMDRARSMLVTGRAIQALAVLDEYERRFPERRFGPEALYLRMEALVTLGRTARARAAAERLLASYPNSPNAARARVVLSKNP